MYQTEYTSVTMEQLCVYSCNIIEYPGHHFIKINNGTIRSQFIRICE